MTTTFTAKSIFFLLIYELLQILIKLMSSFSSDHILFLKSNILEYSLHGPFGEVHEQMIK